MNHSTTSCGIGSTAKHALIAVRLPTEVITPVSLALPLLVVRFHGETGASHLLKSRSDMRALNMYGFDAVATRGQWKRFGISWAVLRLTKPTALTRMHRTCAGLGLESIDW